MALNRLVIDGQLFEIDALRYTPAGIAIINFKCRHESEQIENRVARKTECEVDAVALSDLALHISKLPLRQYVRLEGFLARKNHANSKLILHVNKLEIERKV